MSAPERAPGAATLTRSRPGAVGFRFTDRSHGDLAVDPGGRGAAAEELRRRALVDVPWTWLRQVHGARVVTVTAAGEHAGAEADAAVTDVPGALLSVRTAPGGPRGREADRAVGVAHVGWRGLVAGVVEATVDAMAVLGRTPTRAVLGPCIEAHHYEFGAEALHEVAARYGDAVRGTTGTGSPALDLPAGVAAACEAAGVAFHHEACCTACSDVHWSHRARADRGRQALVAWVAPEPAPGGSLDLPVRSTAPTLDRSTSDRETEGVG